MALDAMMFPVLTRSTLALLLVLQCGCVFALRGSSLQGRHFPHERAPQVREGMSEPEVLALLGTPLVQATAGGAVHWYYYSFTAERACDVYLLGVIKVKSAPTRTREAEVIFLHGEVSDVRVRTSKRFREPRYRLPSAAAASPATPRESSAADAA